jgi:hypothetical protein
MPPSNASRLKRPTPPETEYLRQLDEIHNKRHSCISVLRTRSRLRRPGHRWRDRGERDRHMRCDEMIPASALSVSPSPMSDASLVLRNDAAPSTAGNSRDTACALDSGHEPASVPPKRVHVAGTRGKTEGTTDLSFPSSARHTRVMH